jgi:hypothetical protein
MKPGFHHVLAQLVFHPFEDSLEAGSGFPVGFMFQRGFVEISEGTHSWF